jgi:hypothetical protein
VVRLPARTAIISTEPYCSSAFLIPATASWDEYSRQILPAADMYNQQETLEAVLRQRLTAPRQQQDHHQPAVERELSRDCAAPAVDADCAATAAVPRRRPLRTDRHSKIRTAQGVRDRRMRLSVGVARDFFALQDRLGFDKASKTVNWLLVQSKPAIDRLCDAAVLGAPSFGPPVVKGKKGEGSSSTGTACIKDTRERMMRSRGVLDAPVAVMEDQGGSVLDWNMSEAAAAATELTQPMEGLEYYYQMEEMMRCNNGGVFPR